MSHETTDERERRVGRRDQLESLTRLAGELSHDINNYLTGILGNATMALRKLEADSECRGLVQEIERAALHAAALTERMLTFAGRVDLAAEPVDLAGLIRQMERLVKLAVPSGAELVLDLDPDLPAVRGDGGKLRDLVMQLVLNAGEALPPVGGRIEVVTLVRRVDSTPRAEDRELLPPGASLAPGIYVVLRVRDNGVGMDTATQRRAFDPFFSYQRRGRGLGLAEVLGIVGAHGGALRLESTPGQGTALEVLLPTARGRSGTVERGAERVVSPSGGGEAEPLSEATVMVVDDEEIVRTLASSILEDTGCRVLTAADGFEALALAERGDPAIDVVVLDLTMPGIDGAETFRRLREMFPGLPILLSSGHKPDDILARLGTEPSGFVRKPYRPSDLIEALEVVLAQAGGEE